MARLKRSCLRAAAVAIAASVLCTSGAAGAAALPGSASYGMVAVSTNHLPGTTASERSASYRQLAAGGVRAVRMDVNWEKADPPGPPYGVFDFTDARRDIEEARAAGMQVIAVLAYGHRDYTSVTVPPRVTDSLPLLHHLGAETAAPPDDPRAFAYFAKAAAQALGNDVMAWEVWNEPNLGRRFWPPREDPAAYARLLCTASASLRQVTPTTPVVFGGVLVPSLGGFPGMSGAAFVGAAHRLHPDLDSCWDALGYHPYAYPFTAPELEFPGRRSVITADELLRRQLPARARAKPAWITEAGWPTNNRAHGVSERKQAQYVIRTQLAAFARGIPVVTWYTAGDDPHGSALDQEARFGLMHSDGTAKPALAAMQVMHRVFDGTRFSADHSRALGMPVGRRLRSGGGWALEYAASDRRVLAVWVANESAAHDQGSLPASRASATRTVDIVTRSTDDVQVIDYLGRRIDAARLRGGTLVRVAASHEPRYVIIKDRCASASTPVQARRVTQAPTVTLDHRPGFVGWAIVGGARPACAATSIPAWEWNVGDAHWEQRARRSFELVYVEPFADGWAWTWSQQQGWLAMRADALWADAPSQH